MTKAWTLRIGFLAVGLAGLFVLCVVLPRQTRRGDLVNEAAITPELMAELEGLGLVAAGEHVLYVYAPELSRLADNVKVVTDRGLAVRVAGETQRASYPDIAHLWFADTDADCRAWAATFELRCALGASSSLAVERQNGSRFAMNLGASADARPFAAAAMSAWRGGR